MGPETPHLYYGPDGDPISLWDWADLQRARSDSPGPESWWRKHTQIDAGTEVSSVWIGIDMSWGLLAEAPLVWETMIFGGPHNHDVWRYLTRQAAFDDHERIVRALRAGRDPDEEEESGEQHCHRSAGENDGGAVGGP